MRTVIRDVTHSVQTLATNDKLAFGNDASLQSANGTVGCWMKLPSNGQVNGCAFSKRNAFYVGTNASGVLAFYDYNAAAFRVSTRDIRDNNWHWVDLSYQSGVASGTVLYVDGVAVATGTMTVVNQATAFNIGNDQSATAILGANYTEATFHNVALSVAQILARYLTGRNPSTGLVSRWLVNEGVSTALADSVGVNTGTITGSQWTLQTPMQARRAIVEVPYSLDIGATGKLTVADNASLNVQQFTMRTWVYIPALASYSFLMGKTSTAAWNNGYALAIDPASAPAGLTCWVNLYSNASRAVLPLAQIPLKRWFLATATYDGAFTRLYIDGRLVAKTAYVAAITNSAGVFSIGGTAVGATEPCPNFKFADPIFDDVAWTDAQVRTDALLSRQPAGVVSHWPLDDVGTGTSVRDSVGANTGTQTSTMFATNDTPQHARLQSGEPWQTLAGLGFWAEAGIRKCTEMSGGVASDIITLTPHAGRSLTQATASKRPKMLRDSDGYQNWLFDGVDDFMQGAWTLVQPCTVWIVYKHVSVEAVLNTHEVVFNSQTNLYTMCLLSEKLATPASRIYSGTTLQAPPPLIANGAYAYAALTFNGVSSVVRVNGVNTVTGNAGASAAQGGLTLGALSDGSHSTNIAVRAIGVQAAVASAGEVAMMESWITKRWISAWG